MGTMQMNAHAVTIVLHLKGGSKLPHSKVTRSRSNCTRRIRYRSVFPEGRACSAESPISLRWLFTSRSA
jgi:hypothetical protein